MLRMVDQNKKNRPTHEEVSTYIKILNEGLINKSQLNTSIESLAEKQTGKLESAKRTLASLAWKLDDSWNKFNGYPRVQSHIRKLQTENIRNLNNDITERLRKNDSLDENDFVLGKMQTLSEVCNFILKFRDPKEIDKAAKEIEKILDAKEKLLSEREKEQLEKTNEQLRVEKEKLTLRIKEEKRYLTQDLKIILEQLNQKNAELIKKYGEKIKDYKKKMKTKQLGELLFTQTSLFSQKYGDAVSLAGDLKALLKAKTLQPKEVEDLIKKYRKKDTDVPHPDITSPEAASMLDEAEKNLKKVDPLQRPHRPLHY